MNDMKIEIRIGKGQVASVTESKNQSLAKWKNHSMFMFIITYLYLFIALLSMAGTMLISLMA